MTRSFATLPPLLLASLLAGPLARTAPLDEAAGAACAAVRAAPAADFDAALAVDPPGALALACARWRADASPRHTLDLALALAHADEAAEPPPLFAALREDPTVQAAPALRAELLRAELVRSFAAGQYQVAAAGLPGLRAAREATPLARLEGALLDARLTRRLHPPGWAEHAALALDEAEHGLAALPEPARSAWAGEVYNARTMQAYAQHDIATALRWAERELAVAQAAGHDDALSLIDTYNNIGSFQDQLYRLDEAGATWRRALALVERHPEAGASVRSGAHANYAVHLSNRGLWDEALVQARLADAIGTAAWGERSPRRVEALTRIAESQWFLGRLRDALQTAEQALAIAVPARADVGAQRMMRLHEVHAHALAALGRLDEAEAAVAAGLAEDPRGEQHYRRGRALWKRALLRAARQDWPAAEAALAEAEPALRMIVGTDDHPWLQQITALRCVVQLSIGGAAEACERLDRARPREDEIPYHRAQRLTALAQAARAAGDRPRETELRLAALAAAEHVQGPDPLWRAAAELARLLREQGRRELAVLLGKRAVQALQALRRDAAADALGLEQDFLADKRAVYERLADWLTEDGRLAEALAVLALLKEQELHEFTRGAALALASEAPALSYTAAEQRALARWADTGGAEQVPAREPARREAAEAERERERTRRLLAEEAERIGDWRRELATRPADAAPAAAPPEPARPRVAAGELHLHAYAVGASLNLVFDSADGRRRLLRRAIAPGELDRRIGQWLAAIGRPAGGPDDAEPASYFSALLAQPVSRQSEIAGARRLVLHLSGNLRYLPWAALDDGRGPLGARLALLHAGGAAPSPPQPGPVRPTLRVLASTQGGQGLPRLPALAREVCAIVDGPAEGWAADDPPCPARGALRGRAWLNAAFTRARLAEASSAALPQPGERLLHLASHFMLRPGLMASSWLQLGDGSRLSLAELARLDFHGQTLVTLSACETGIGGEGAEVEGLNQLILRRGAGRVLASLWRVDDQSTAALMGAFYRALAAGRAPAEALATAQATVRAEPRWAAPFYWAGFYLVA